MKILIINLHCADNLGDAAIVYETLRGAQTAFPEASVTAAATIPDSWQRYATEQIVVVGSFAYWLVRCENGHWRARRWLAPLVMIGLACAVVLYRLFRFRLYFGSAEQRTLLEAYYSADLVLSTGGGYFYANWPFSPFLIWSLLSILFALGLGKRIIQLPQSVGPIQGRFQRFLVRQVLERMSVIMVREPLSADFLSQVLGVRKPSILLPDLAFNLPAGEPLDRNQLPSAGAKLRIGVTVIDRGLQTRGGVSQTAYERALEGALKELLRRYDAEIYLFVQCSGPDVTQDDRDVTRRFYDRLHAGSSRVHLLSPFGTPLEIKAAYGSMDLVIASRMHAAILTLNSFTPVILIAYQPKATGTMAGLGLSPYCLEIEALTEEQLLKAATKVLEQTHDVRREIATGYEVFRAQLADWPHYLQEVMPCDRSA
jgi:colanic acid/amylovoran biosynthesis protein